ncbi:MAG TPA: glucose 1-dehydrogenase [Gaiellaceae bacterium]|nr:glucose 1-dehydrogenase [Gaiellaceae bacterium]
MDLKGKVAIVTGAGSGIGAAIAQALADAGAAVCINYYRAYEDEARKHAASLPRAIAVSADVSSPEDAAQLVSTTVEELGGLDVLVNNAGIEHSIPLLDLDAKDWDAVIAVNLRGAFCCLQAAGRAMRDSGRGGSIVNISSIHEDVAFPGFASYCASKGGLRMLMRNAAVELAPYRIRVNNVAPGAIKTPINATTLNDPQKVATLQRIIPLARMGEPSEVASAAVFLASDLASYVTGSTYFVDGGMVRYAEPL